MWNHQPAVTGVSKAQYIGILSWFNVAFAYRDHGLWASYCHLESFPDSRQVIQVFQIQNQTKNYTAKYNANTKPNLV